jgi:endonuclease/exonuclease/phosphatase family metal-dependent hydrolase
MAGISDQMGPRMTTRLSLALLSALAATCVGQDAPVQSSTGQGSLTADRTDRVIFCSYNIKNWLQMERTTKGEPDTLEPKPEKEKAAVVQTLIEIHPDVLGVCEIGTDDDLTDLQARLKAAGLDLPHKERTHGMDRVRSLGLLSRYPIVSRNSQTNLTYQIGEIPFQVQRGFLDVVVELRPDFQLHCIGVHLKSMREVVEADQGIMRRNEADLLRRHVDRILEQKPDTRLLLYGDFNDHPRNITIESIKGDRASGTPLRDVYLKDLNDQVWTHFYDWEDSYSRLDYFFVNQALQPFVGARQSFIYHTDKIRFGSDHRPIVLSIALQQTKRTRSKSK